MREFTLRRVAPYDCRDLYELVADIERYPDFVPGYIAATIRHREAGRLSVTQTVGIMGWHVSFDSTAVLDPPRTVAIEARPRGFRTLQIVWEFRAVASRETEIVMRMTYELQGAVMGRIFGRWAERLGEVQVRAFLDRARMIFADADSSPGTPERR